MKSQRFYKTSFPQKDDITTYDNGFNKNTLQDTVKRCGQPLRIVSIDPGSQNFCIRIEDRPRSVNQSPAVKINQIYLGLWKLGDEDIRYMNLTGMLNGIKDMVLSADIIIVEEQMNFNPKILRMAQHAISWVYFCFWDSSFKPKLVEMSAKLKLKIINCPKNLNKKGYKDWTIEWARKEFVDRKDDESLKLMGKKKKLDDIADTLAQIEAYCIHNAIPASSAIYQ
jgi:hypothetical protein